eukprot:m.176995 g.176995  ORF g.176995 m.176995 type:complete len:282 (+) comp14262_c0_seq1:63-908(+)
MSRPGDWRCPSCSNHNFKFRTVCNRCQLAKPEGNACDISRESKGRTRPGDWECCECGNRNFAFRDICNRCDLPRFVTQTFMSASLLDEEGNGSPKVAGISLLDDLIDEEERGPSPSTPGTSDCSDTASEHWGNTSPSHTHTHTFDHMWSTRTCPTPESPVMQRSPDQHHHLHMNNAAISPILSPRRNHSPMYSTSSDSSSAPGSPVLSSRSHLIYHHNNNNSAPGSPILSRGGHDCTTGSSGGGGTTSPLHRYQGSPLAHRAAPQPEVALQFSPYVWPAMS